MRRYRVICLGVMAMMWLTVVGAGASAGPQTLTEKDSGRNVTLRMGERLVLNLRNPGSGGYSEITPIFNEAVLRLADQRKEPPAREPVPRLGDFGRLIFIWEAQRPGDSEILIQIARPWEKETPPIAYFRVQVRVMGE